MATSGAPKKMKISAMPMPTTPSAAIAAIREVVSTAWAAPASSRAARARWSQWVSPARGRQAGKAAQEHGRTECDGDGGEGDGEVVGHPTGLDAGGQGGSRPAAAPP